MKEIEASTITQAVTRLCQQANIELGEDVLAALKRAQADEESPLGKEVLGQILENARIACEESIPLCQDCGFAVFLVEQGNEVAIEDASLRSAIDEGVRQGYEEGYLRKSIVDHPVYGKNTGDNTPSVIHVFPTEVQVVLGIEPHGVSEGHVPKPLAELDRCIGRGKIPVEKVPQARFDAPIEEMGDEETDRESQNEFIH